MTDDILRSVEPMPNDTIIDLSEMSDTTPKKRKTEAIDRSSIAPSESSIPDKGIENGKKPAKRPRKTDEEKEADKLLKEHKAAEKEKKAAAREAETKAKQAEKEARQAEKEAKLAEKEAENKAKQAEKDAKAAEKAQQAALKAEKEKEKAAAAEKLAEAKRKQKNVMSSFFKKKEGSSSPVKGLISRASPAGPSRTKSPERQPSPEKLGSDYERTFKGPIIRPNARWAEINVWSQPRGAKPELSEEEIASWRQDGAPEVQGWTSKDFLRDHLDRHKLKPTKRRRLPNGLKSAPIGKSVGEVWADYLASDNPRAVLDQLKDENRYPWKTLSFHHENRPPYRGTFTKRSVCVGPRTPFGQDPTIDYAYDSDAEWVDDEGDGVDAADAADSEEEEEEEEGESEGEFDDWLDDSKDAVKKKIAKRKFVEIVPTWSGPLWEDKLGYGTSGMEDYRIRCLNDTPLHSIDPFNWVSEHPEQHYRAEYAVFAADNGGNVPCLIKSKRIGGKKTGAKVEEVEPVEEKPSDPFTTAANTASSKPSVPAKTKTPSAPPPFPALYLPQFLKIVSGSSLNEADLLAKLKTEIPFASKATLKAKLKETAQKIGSKKDVKWVLKKRTPKEETAVKRTSSDLPMDE